jgi:PKD repeat protein
MARPWSTRGFAWHCWRLAVLLCVGLVAGCGGGTAPESTSLAPQARLAGAGTGTVGTPVSFSAAGSSDPQGQALNYIWSFGDNTSGTGLSTSHAYAAAGTYTVTLKVTDTSNLTATTTGQVTITAATQAALASGTVFGGQQPIGGATVQLWQVGTTGYGTGATPLGSSATTLSNGSFSITGNYSCLNAVNGVNTLVYITATGGNPGLAPGTNNSAITLMAALGPCSSLGPSTFISMDEVTTVASVYALAQFMSPSGGIGSFGSSNQGLVNAFATVNNLSNIATGVARSLTPNGNGVVPQAEINTLADILAPCVNSAGPTSAECSSLFTAATPAGGSVPATMLAAALDIALNPANNVASLLLLPTPQAPFQPTVNSANDLTLAIGFASGGSAPKSLALDATGNVWVANYGSGGGASSVSMMTPLGVPATNSPFSGASYVNGVSSIAIDTGNNVWLANQDNSSAMELNASLSGSNYSINPVGAALTAIGLNSPSAVAVDASNNVWFANNGNNSVTKLPNSGCSTTSCATSYTGGGLNAPGGIALDSAGAAWVINGPGASVTKINAVGVLSNYTGGGVSSPASIAIDGLSNAWVTDTTKSQISELNIVGAAVSPSAGYTGGGLTGSFANAIDGSGNVWAADVSGNRISALSAAGSGITPATGYQSVTLSAPVSLAIDASGNIWVANNTPVLSGALSLTVTEFVGVAPPAIMPLAQAVTIAEIGQKPGTAPVTKAPTAVASGPYTGTAGTTVSFNGGASADPKGEALSYSWNFGDGSGGSGATPVHSYFSSGPYPVSLTVTNADGLQSTASASAAIAGVPAAAPVANAGGPYSGTAYTALTLNGLRSSDPASPLAGALALNLAWNFGDGTQGSGPTPVHTYAAAGTYAVTLTAQTAAGTTATATTSATVAAGTAPSGAPTASPGGPYAGAAGASVSFNGSGSSDPNSLALTYFWQFGDGSSANTANATHSFAQGGTYSAVLTVSNGTSSSSAGTTATITGAALAPMVASAGGPYTVAVNQPLTLSGANSTSPSGRQLNFAWDFGDGFSGTGSNPIHVYTTQGTYTAHLNVNDGLTENGNATAQVTVGGPATEAITATAGGPYQDVTGQTIILDASASGDNLGNPLTYTWDFGDGSLGSGATPTHAYAAAGTYAAKVTVSSGTASSTATAGVAVSAAISVMVTTPTANAIFATNTVTVSGTASAPNLTVAVNGVPATVSGTSFTATGVSLREGVNLISATATDGHGGVGSGVVSVILDVTAPGVSITSPAKGATVTTSAVTVAGLVNDIVTGTIGSNDVTVTVNGLPAQVANRSYLLPSLQLAPGINTITVVATDRVGNTSQTSETVQLLPPTSQLSLVKLSGDSQTGVVQAVLPQTLAVRLVAASGTPVAGRPVTFTVTRSDGMVEVMPTIAQAISVTTDATGKASVLFQLGSRSGLGINLVSATTPGAAGAAVFTETSTVGAPAQIHAVTGDNQRGLLGEPLAQAFQVIVQDANGNPVPGVTVNYTSIGATDGTLDHASPVTDGNGKAIANLTLGQQEGLSNYAVTADFAGDTATVPVSFVASAYAPGPVSNTSVSGVVMDNTNTPVQNATVTIQGTSLSTVTNASGNFKISGAPVGTVTLTVDGSTAVSTETLPFLSFVLQDLPGQNNTLGKPIFLPAIDINDAQTVGGNDPVTLTMAGVPGLAFTVAPNSVTFPDGSTVGKLSLSQVKSDLVPMEPSNGTGPRVVWTLQPAGTRFSVPIQVTVPNTAALAPGAVTEIFQYDHDLEQFVSSGTAHVSADGSVIVSDPGFGITKAGWSHCCTPPVNNGCVTSCFSTNPCITAQLSPSGCLCYKIPKPGAACGKANTSTGNNYNSCWLQGVCDKYGQCGGRKVTAGIPCVPKPDFCDIAGECSGTGQCVSTGKIPDKIEHELDDGGPDSISASTTADDIFKPANKFLADIGFPVIVTAHVGNSASHTYTCCAASQQLDQEILDDTVSVDITISSKEVPLRLPNGVPMGVSLSNGTVWGAFGQVGGSFTGSLTLHSDTCRNKRCSKFGFVPAATLTMGIHLPADYINIGIELSGGFQLSTSVGCGEATVTFSTLPIVATGKAQLFGTYISASATLVPSVNLLGPYTYTF